MPQFDVRSDVWSLGLSLLEMASLHHPYQTCRTYFELYKRITDGNESSAPMSLKLRRAGAATVCRGPDTVLARARELHPLLVRRDVMWWRCDDGDGMGFDVM